MFTKASNEFDYTYYNHSNKTVCFKYNSKKRMKGKTIEFLKKEHQESKIIQFCKENDLKLNLFNKSNRYIMYEITD